MGSKQTGFTITADLLATGADPGVRAATSPRLVREFATSAVMVHGPLALDPRYATPAGGHATDETVKPAAQRRRRVDAA